MPVASGRGAPLIKSKKEKLSRGPASRGTRARFSSSAQDSTIPGRCRVTSTFPPRRPGIEANFRSLQERDLSRTRRLFLEMEHRGRPRRGPTGACRPPQSGGSPRARASVASDVSRAELWRRSAAQGRLRMPVDPAQLPNQDPGLGRRGIGPIEAVSPMRSLQGFQAPSEPGPGQWMGNTCVQSQTPHVSGALRSGPKRPLLRHGKPQGGKGFAVRGKRGPTPGRARKNPGGQR